MNATFFYTDVLKPAMAKKIVESLTTSQEWKDVLGGTGGIVVDSESVEITVDASSLAKIVVPNSAFFELKGRLDAIDSLRTPYDLLGGYLHGLPDDIGDTGMSIRAISEASGITFFHYKLENSLLQKHNIRKWFPENKFSSKSSATLNVQYYVSDQLPQEAIVFEDYKECLVAPFADLTEIFQHLGIPSPSFDDVIRSGNHFNWANEKMIDGLLRWSMICTDKKFYLVIMFDPMVIPQWNLIHIQMQEWLNKKGCAYELSTSVNYGGMNWFAGLTGCVTMEANELIQKEAANPQYDTYLIRYMKLEPDTWESREKRRKKATKPIIQQLGECTLENGVKLTLRIKILKQGYEISVDFPSPDDMANFLDTELYRMTTWHCSAE